MTKIEISGMRCRHCAESVTKTLGALPGLGDIQIDLEKGLARCQGSAPAEDIRQAIHAIGFEVLGVPQIWASGPAPRTPCTSAGPIARRCGAAERLRLIHGSAVPGNRRGKGCQLVSLTVGTGYQARGDRAPGMMTS